MKSTISHSSTHPLHHYKALVETHLPALQRLVTRLVKEKKVTQNWIAETTGKDPAYVSRALIVTNKKGVKMPNLTEEQFDLWWEQYSHMNLSEFLQVIKEK